MSKCELRISLDQPDASYQIGDTVHCTVHVSVSDSVECKGLTLNRFWRTHGRGNRVSGNSEKIVLFKGRWAPGEYQYKHSFEIRNGPLTYHGKIVNVDWYLKAQADIPWAFDPKAETEFLVKRRPHAEGPDIFEDHEIETQDTSHSARANSKWLAAIPLLLLGIGGSMLYSGYNESDIQSLFIGGMMSAFGLFVAFKFFRNTLAERKVSNVRVSVQPKQLRPDSHCKINLGFTARDNLNLNQISATLLGTEIAVSGSGTKRTTHRHEFYNRPHTLHRGSTITVGRRVSCQLDLAIPADAAASFSERDNRVEWKVELTIDIASWPDWKTTEPITILT